MHPLVTAVLSGILLIGTVGGASFAGVTAGQTGDGDHASAPGERLGGVVSVTDAELDGEIDERTTGVRIARAASDTARADVVAAETARLEDRIDDLETRRETLETARASGDISTGRYEAKLAVLLTESASIERRAATTERGAQDVPTELLAARGVDPSAIRALGERASELGGPETAAIARRIAGPDVGTPIGSSSIRGPTDARNETGSTVGPTSPSETEDGQPIDVGNSTGTPIDETDAQS